MHKKKHISDGELVTQYLSGNQKALAILVKRFHKTFCNHAFWIVKDADVAKDIAQESWKSILEKLQGLQNQNRFKSWALQIVHRKAIDYSRSVTTQTKRKNEYKLTQSVQEIPVHDNDFIKKRLKEAIKKLPMQQQEIIHLFYVNDYSLKEISSLLAISVGTAKSRLYHAREQLKKQLKK